MHCQHTCNAHRPRTCIIKCLWPTPPNAHRPCTLHPNSPDPVTCVCPAGPTDTQHPQPRVLPARSSLAGFACRSGALLLAHALFPDHTHHLLTWLAVPVALADSAGVLAAATPAAAQQAVRRRAQGLKGRLQRRRGAGEGVGWVDGVQGALQGSMHTLRSLSGEGGLGMRACSATGGMHVAFELKLWTGSAGLVGLPAHLACGQVLPKVVLQGDCMPYPRHTQNIHAR
jgi:hypothetical protein